jgi:hypothetical protein
LLKRFQLHGTGDLEAFSSHRAGILRNVSTRHRADRIAVLLVNHSMLSLLAEGLVLMASS